MIETDESDLKHSGERPYLNRVSQGGSCAMQFQACYLRRRHICVLHSLTNNFLLGWPIRSCQAAGATILRTR